MEYKVELKTEISVEFENEGLVESFFFDSDWKESFYDFDDLTELVGFIAFNWNQHSQIEGFAEFERIGHQMFVSDGLESYGKIIVKVSESTYVDSVYYNGEYL